MSINSAKNYLYSGNIKKGYDEIIKLLKSDSFESEEAFNLFSDSILGNMNNLKKLHTVYKDWYRVFPIDKYSFQDNSEIFGNIKITIFASALLNSDFDFAESFSKIKITSPDTDFETFISSFTPLQADYGRQLYLLLKENLNTSNSFSIWLVSNDQCVEKYIHLVKKSDGIELINTSKNIDSTFQASLSKAYLNYKKFSQNKKIGFAIEIQNVSETEVLEGSSASLAFFAAMYFCNNIPKHLENTAFMADLDLSEGTLLPVDPIGLKIKIKKAIENGFSQVVISPQNLHAVLEFQDKIKITSYKTVKEMTKAPFRLTLLLTYTIILSALLISFIMPLAPFFLVKDKPSTDFKIPEPNLISENSFLLNIEQIHIGQSDKPALVTDIIRELKNNAWKKFSFSSGFQIKSGDGIQLSISTNSTPSYFYILNLSNKNKVSPLFPWNVDTLKQNPVIDKYIVFPKTFKTELPSWTSEFYWINEIEGNETILVISSDNRLDKLEALISKSFQGEVVVSREKIINIIK